MAKKTVFSKPVADESHNRNPFDRSLAINFNLSAGMLIPTFCKFVFGHSHVRINQSSFMRTADINTPAFPSMPMYTDYFFVPMHQLLTNWNAFRSATLDRASGALPVPTMLPSFNAQDLRALFTFGLANTDGANGSLAYGAMRLLDMLDYGLNYKSIGSAQTPVFANFGSCHPFAACAYQKVYYDHYRNTAYERNNVKAYNLDDLIAPNGVNTDVDTAAPSAFGTNRLSDIFCLRYANYRRDFFNTVYPSLNFIDSSISNPLRSNRLPSSVVGVGYVLSGSFSSDNATRPVVSSDGLAVSPTSSVLGTNNRILSSGFTLENLRASFAIEKLLRVSAFAPQHVVDQFAARFGYRPKSDAFNESVRLGSFVNEIIAGEVTNTANTVDTSDQSIGKIGEIGGKGVGASRPSKPIAYDVPEDGFLIGISYVLPRMTYDSNKVDMIHNQLYAEDWSLPEFENLGLQPILAKNLKLTVSSPTETDAQMAARGNAVVGYQPRDMQYKASISTNHGLFASVKGFGLSSFVFHGRVDWLDGIIDTPSYTGGLNKDYFKCVPADLDFIFAQDYDSEDPSTDQFFGHMEVNFACIQDKPIFGIPRL